MSFELVWTAALRENMSLYRCLICCLRNGSTLHIDFARFYAVSFRIEACCTGASVCVGFQRGLDSFYDPCMWCSYRLLSHPVDHSCLHVQVPIERGPWVSMPSGPCSGTWTSGFASMGGGVQDDGELRMSARVSFRGEKPWNSFINGYDAWLQPCWQLDDWYLNPS